MMSILYVLWMYVILFAVIGMLRGWAKELLVGFSVILALALNLLLKQYIPIVRDLPDDSVSLFWIRTLILVALVYFGYQTVAIVPHLASKATRERLQDALFGAILGGDQWLSDRRNDPVLYRPGQISISRYYQPPTGGIGRYHQPDDGLYAASFARRARHLLRRNPVPLSLSSSSIYKLKTEF